MTSTCERCEATGRTVQLVNGECPKCSWMPPRQSKSSSARSKTQQRDSKCSYESGNIRCVLNATWYPDNRFKGYCALHDTEDKRKLPPWEAQDQLKRIRDHPADYARDLLEGSWTKERERLIQRTIEQHPDWQRGEEEGSTAYAKRMLAISKQLGKGIRARYVSDG